MVGPDVTVEGVESNLSWWRMVTSPSAMFPHVPHSVAVILYSSVVIAALVIVLTVMWLCTCLASRRKSISGTAGGSIVGVQAKGQSPASCKKSVGPPASNEANGGTLKDLENMQWWEYVSKHPYVNWYDYYRKIEGKSRSRPCDKHCRSGKNNHRRNRPKQNQMLSRMESNIMLPYDKQLERPQPQQIDRSQYHPISATTKSDFLPRFPMIPRARWTNERLLGHIISTCDECASRSIATLNSSDMQVMQMITKRPQLQLIRPNHGDVFFGHYMRPHGMYSHQLDSVGTAPVSPYELHNRCVSQRHSSGISPQEVDQQQRTNSVLWPHTLPNEETNYESPATNSQLPLPEYPPPPVPLSEP